MCGTDASYNFVKGHEQGGSPLDKSGRMKPTPKPLSIRFKIKSWVFRLYDPGWVWRGPFKESPGLGAPVEVCPVEVCLVNFLERKPNLAVPVQWVEPPRGSRLLQKCPCQAGVLGAQV